MVATWNNPQEAAELANALAQALVDYAHESIDNFESDTTTVDFTVISEASAPVEPVDIATNTIAISLIAGLVTGLILAFLRYLSNTQLRSRDEAESLSGLDVLCELPLRVSTRPGRRKRIVSQTTIDDAFRKLRASIVPLMTQSDLRVLLLTSPQSEEGSPGVAHGLAQAIAESDSRVALVNLNLRETDADIVGTNVGVGLADLLAGTASLNDLLKQDDSASMLSIPAGMTDSDPALLLASRTLDTLVDDLRERFDVVLLNAPAVLRSADAVSVAHLADGAIVVIGAGQTKRNDLAESLRTLELSGTQPVALIAVT